MSKRKVTTYTLEFKQSSAKLAAESDQPVTHTARELGINSTTLHGWVKQYYPSNKSTTNTATDDTQAELKRLRKELMRVKQERDILKKAAAYFANFFSCRTNHRSINTSYNSACVILRLSLSSLFS